MKSTSSAEFPILEFDPDPKALIEPGTLRRSCTEMPAAGVLCFFHDVITHLKDAGLLTEIASLRSEMGAHPVYRLVTAAGPVALLHPGIGAPLAAALLEEAIALGGRTFIACGGAGVLDRAIAVGTVLVPATAVRDEGTSYHYLPPSREVALAPAVVSAIEAALTAKGVPHQRVKTWTTDAFYRETLGRIARRRAEGCACVEMETAALAAVAQFRQITFGQLLYGGDDVSGETWDSRGWTGKWSVREQLTLLAAEIAAGLNQ
jgi:uridine phosphorylase